MSKIFCLGPSGTFSFTVAEKFSIGKNLQIVTELSIADVFSKLSQEAQGYGVIPIENTIAGVVGAHQDFLVEYCQKESLQIVSEIDCAVKFCLIANSSNLSKIDFIYAHPHAYEQCQVFKMKHMPNAQIKYTKSTILAAEYFLNKKDKELSAAIVPLEYAKKNQTLYNYNQTAEHINGIQDAKLNITRFFIVSRQNKQEFDFSLHKTSLFIETIKDEPALLFNILSPLANLKVNMTFLNSRASRSKPWIYNFFVDLINNPKHPDDTKLIFSILQRFEFIKVTILGTYDSFLTNNNGC